MRHQQQNHDASLRSDFVMIKFMMETASNQIKAVIRHVCVCACCVHGCLLLTSHASDHMENIDGYLMKYTNLVTGWQYR